MAGLTRDSGQLNIGIFPWGDVVEEFLDPIGLNLEDFALRMTGGWLFGYVAALQVIGYRAAIICASENIDAPVCHHHVGTGAPIWFVPGKRANIGRGGDGHSLRRWWNTPVRHFRDVLNRERCNALLIQEYENPRFDALTLLGWSMGLPVYASFQGGDVTFSRTEAAARRISLRHCSGLLVASARERDRIGRSYAGLDLRVLDVANPIDTAEWQALDAIESRDKLGLSHDLFIAVNHGRLDIRRKGLDVLLQAWLEFTQRVSATVPTKLVVIGSGQDHAEFAKMIKMTGLTNIHWLDGYVTDRPLIRRWLSAANVYVTASRTEGMPVAPLEAMACGLPIIASDAHGLPDILAGGEISGGIIVGREQSTAIATALLRLHACPELRQRLGRAARQRVEDKFSIPAVGRVLKGFLAG